MHVAAIMISRLIVQVPCATPRCQVAKWANQSKSALMASAWQRTPPATTCECIVEAGCVCEPHTTGQPHNNEGNAAPTQQVGRTVTPGMLLQSTAGPWAGEREGTADCGLATLAIVDWWGIAAQYLQPLIPAVFSSA